MPHESTYSGNPDKVSLSDMLDLYRSLSTDERVELLESLLIAASVGGRQVIEILDDLVFSLRVEEDLEAL